MQYSRYILFSDDILPNDALPKDDVDELFERLEQVEPPPSLIARILSSIFKLPLSQQHVTCISWDDLDSLVVRREELPPS